MKKMPAFLFLICLIALTLTACGRSVTPAGSRQPLDTAFDTDGKVTTDIGGSTDAAYAVAIQTDGKIVAAGTSSNGFSYVFALARYNTDGSLDTAFNTTGMVTTDIAANDDEIYGVAIQPDGKIVAAGYSWNGAGYDFAVARYNTDGSLDTAFNTTGTVITPIGASDSQAYAVAIQTDGKIVVAGYSYNGVNDDFAVVRYNTDGSLDTAFNTTGKVTTPIGASSDYAQAVAIQTDGKIVAAGYSRNGTDYDFAVVRYNTDGSLDTAFDTDGKVTTPIGASDDKAYAVAIHTDGKIAVAGNSWNGADNDFAVVRYNTNGSLDTAFDKDGRVTTPIGAGFAKDDFAYAVAIQTDGKIVAAGTSYNAADQDFTLVRYRP